MSEPSDQQAHAWTHDQKVRRVELIISNLLRFGVMTSLLIVLLGTVISFIRHPDYLSQPSTLSHLTTPGSALAHSLREVLHGCLQLRGQSFVMLGLLLLIATPVLRVAVSIVGFAWERDRQYVVITTIVLCLLAVSFLIGAAE